MAQGEKLTKALEWCDKGINLEKAGKDSLRDRCMNKMVELEAEGLAAGESWD